MNWKYQMAPAKEKQAKVNTDDKSEKNSHFYQFVMGGFGFD